MQRMFLNETVELFTKAPQDVPYKNSRALGWDTIPSGYPNVCGQKFTPGYSFGHTGYTGTTLWGDFKRDFALISLTNRVWPNDTAALGWFRNNLANMIIDRIDANSTNTQFITE
jgi:CubicO group peptidase (beta-lactamase class C family)